MLSEIQRERREWAARNFPGANGLFESLMGMTEEMGELAHAVLKRHQGIRGTDAEHAEAIKDACADLVIFMMGVADAEGFDLELVIAQTWDAVKRRNWVENKTTGFEPEQMVMEIGPRPSA